MTNWWNVPEIPSDIRATARALAALWDEELGKLETATGERIYTRIPLGARDAAGDRILGTLLLYDARRTQYIENLKAEIIRLHGLLPLAPMVIGRGPAPEVGVSAEIPSVGKEKENDPA